MGERRDRERRKHEHIQAVRALEDQGTNGFEDVALLPVSASEIDVDEISLEVNLLGHSLRSPVIVNAMTGGTEEAKVINGRLAAFAKRNGLAMAVGSQTAALKDPTVSDSYVVTREVNPDGVIIANVGMGADLATARSAISMIDGNLLQIHWNTAQELFMAEGDRHFKGMLNKLCEVTAGVSVPIIAKEIGQGMTGPAAERFVSCGVHSVDIGGVGGTNFIAVEAWRQGVKLDPEWQRWGVPTASSLGEVIDTVAPSVAVIASGGIRSGHDIGKAIAMGASAVGVAGSLMRIATGEDPDRKLDEWLESIHWTLRMIMVLMGARSLGELQERPVLVLGRTREWLGARGHEQFCASLATREIKPQD